MERHPEVIPGEPGKPRIVFFVGCMTNFVYTEVGEAALALFRHLGCTVIIPKEQQCCGLPGMSGGDLDTVRELAEKNLAELERYEADYVMTACATCGGALHKFYPLVIGKRHPELTARLKALADKTVDAAATAPEAGPESGRDRAGETLRITYHDPCHLRTRGITKQPRELLRGTPGVELAEMEGADRCCGLGGTFNVYHYEILHDDQRRQECGHHRHRRRGRGHRLSRLHDAAFRRAEAARLNGRGAAHPGTAGAPFEAVRTVLSAQVPGTVFSGAEVISMVQRCFFSLMVLLLLGGCAVQRDFDRQKAGRSETEHAQFDLDIAWDVTAGVRETRLDGLIRNVWSAGIEELELRIELQDSNARTVAARSLLRCTDSGNGRNGPVQPDIAGTGRNAVQNLFLPAGMSPRAVIRTSGLQSFEQPSCNQSKLSTAPRQSKNVCLSCKSFYSDYVSFARDKNIFIDITS